MPHTKLLGDVMRVYVIVAKTGIHFSENTKIYGPNERKTIHTNK